MRTFIILFLLTVSSGVAALDAYPGAVGLGKDALGGRNGTIYKIETLNDSGTGSLRECMTATGARVCLILVDGDIYLDSEIVVQNANLSVIGQTAPGQGVQLRNKANQRNGIAVEADDVVIRHIKVRLGPNLWETNQVTDPDADDFCLHDGTAPGGTTFEDCCTTVPNAIQVASQNDVEDVVIDHVSVQWATDQQIAHNQNALRVTWSNNIFAEALKVASHCQGTHSKGPNMRGCGWTMWGNYIATGDVRNPNTTCGKDGFGTQPNGGVGGGSETGITYYVNNLAFGNQTGYNDMQGGRGEGWHNIVGNVSARGDPTRINNSMPHAFDAFDYGPLERTYSDDQVASGTADPMHICVQDNIVEGLSGSTGASDGSHTNSQYAGLRGDGDDDFCTGPGTPYDCCLAAGDGKTCGDDTHLVESTDCVNDPVTELTTYDGTPVCPVGETCYDFQIGGTPIAASAVVDSVMENAGAIPWNRDDTDARVLLYYYDGADGGSIPDHPLDDVIVADENCTGAGTPEPQCTGNGTGNYGSYGWPTLETGTAPTDTDDDGIPDNVETACGWGSSTYNPWNDHDTDGYGNVEEYVNYLAGDQSTVCSAYPPSAGPSYLPMQRI